MPTILTDFSAPVLAKAIEDSMNEVFALFARSVPNTDLQDTAELFRFATGIPFFLANGVGRTRLPAERADAVIAETLGYFQARDLPMMWIVGPQTQPADLGSRLAAQGLISRNAMPGMAILLERLPDPPLPPGATVEEVMDAGMLREWTQACSAGYEMPYEVAEAFACISNDLGFGEQAPIRSFLARQDGKPVACSTLFLGVGVAGLYCVATVPEARRQGLGAAVATAPLKAAKASGYRIGVLQASEMGHAVYQRLGFEEFCKVRAYIWFGSSSTQEKDEG
jgi:GNAT superfamily N-acetyltransferase